MTTTFASISEHQNHLTEVQRSMFNAVWERLVATGKPFPKRGLPSIAPGVSIDALFKDLGRELIYDVTDESVSCFTLTAAGAFLTEHGGELAALLLRLVWLIKEIYVEDNFVKSIQNDAIQSRLCLSDADTYRLFTILLQRPAGIPFYLVGWHADRSTWSIAVTDDIVNLYNAPDISQYFEELLLTWFKKFQPQEIPMLPNVKPAITSAPSNQLSAYVDLTRLAMLRGSQNPNFDCTKLIRLCEELNECAVRGNAYASMMLIRAILDHVPPIFGLSSFAQVASNYSGNGSSFKKSMERLEKHARTISDRYLHSQIRSQEIAPTMNEVDFSSELEGLLSEVCRVLKPVIPPVSAPVDAS
jgi:hypothetical protein